MQYKLIQKNNPRNYQAQKKWYALAVNKGLISVEELADRIAWYSALTPGDVLSVIDNLFKLIPDLLENGHSVSLERLGRVRLNLLSIGADSPEKFKVFMINGTHIVYTPSVTIKNQFKNMTFQRVT